MVVTGRSTRAGRSDLDRPETIEQTAEQVTAAGGWGIPIRCDHSDPAQVEDLVRQVRELPRANEPGNGGLDVLVNDIWGGDALIEWKPVWEHDLKRGLTALRRAIETHIITSHHVVPLLLDGRSDRSGKPDGQPGNESDNEPGSRPEGKAGDEPGAAGPTVGPTVGSGLVVEITDGDERTNALFPDGYRGGFFYDLIKKTVIQLAKTQAAELRPYGVTAVALTPGFLRSEDVLDHFGVSEDNWRDGIAKDPHFAYSETPTYIGRAVAALAADPDVLARTGRSLEVAELAREYGFTDRDGTRPDFASYFREVLVPRLPAILEQARESG